MTLRDRQRSAVYAAESFVRTLFDRAAQHNSRAVDFFGESITLPPEARFASVESVQRYVDQVLAMPGVARMRPDCGPLAVRGRRGVSAAHYERTGERTGELTGERTGQRAVIAVPDQVGADWAMRELVVLHEVAHHLCPPETPAHGPDFVATFCDLAATVMGPEAGLVLRIVYAREGVR